MLLLRAVGSVLGMAWGFGWERAEGLGCVTG